MSKDTSTKSIITVSPFRCRMWTLHDRLESTVNERTCRAEIDSFQRHGQLVPVLGRPLQGDPDYDIELIYGARRLFAARHINKPLSVELRMQLPDKDALIAMDIENRQRKDISPYERSQSYARWLREGHFQSQEDIARSLRVSKSKVSRLLRMARLPSVVVAAFESPVDICENWGLDLLEVLDDPHRREQTMRRSRVIGELPRRPSARDIYRQLLAASGPGAKVKPKAREDIVKDKDGHSLFRIRHQTHSVAIVVPIENLTASSLESIRNSIADILRSTSVARDSNRSRQVGPKRAVPLHTEVEPTIGSAV